MRFIHEDVACSAHCKPATRSLDSIDIVVDRALHDRSTVRQINGSFRSIRMNICYFRHKAQRSTAHIDTQYAGTANQRPFPAKTAQSALRMLCVADYNEVA